MYVSPHISTVWANTTKSEKRKESIYITSTGTMKGIWMLCILFAEPTNADNTGNRQELTSTGTNSRQYKLHINGLCYNINAWVATSIEMWCVNPLTALGKIGYIEFFILNYIISCGFCCFVFIGIWWRSEPTSAHTEHTTELLCTYWRKHHEYQCLFYFFFSFSIIFPSHIPHKYYNIYLGRMHDR